MIKYFNFIGLLACVALVVACFLPWGFYADVNQTFTGLYSYQNSYGKPGKLLIALAIIIFILMVTPRIWAKRANLFVCALCVGYAIKSYVLYTACYNANCPQKKIGLFLMLVSSLVMLVAAALPSLPIKSKE